MEFVHEWVDVDPKDFYLSQRYFYLSRTTGALRDFARRRGINAPWLETEWALAGHMANQTQRELVDKYASDAVCWGTGDVKNAIWIRRKANPGESGCKLPWRLPNTDNYLDFIGQMFPEFAERRIRSVTLQVTENCNLRCSYCYQINKTCTSMSPELALQFMDMVLEDKIPYCTRDNAPGLIVEFIGGEPFLEIDLVRQVTERVLEKAIETRHPWHNFIRFSFSTNGTLHRNEKVRAYLEEFAPFISFSVSVDGDKELHDSCRVFENGSGSYDLALEAAKDWARRSGESLTTKMTLAPANIEHTSKAIINLIENGYRLIHVNCVFEKGWTLDHARILYREMQKLSDWMFENQAYDRAYVRLFSETDFTPMDPNSEDDEKNWCGGTGDMLALDRHGVLYPCIRYMASSLGGEVPPMPLGRIENGEFIQTEQEQKCLSCLQCITRKSQSTQECYECPIARGCAWCSAYNYQVYGTPDKRATYICWMHKARALANIEHWDRYSDVTGVDKRIQNNMKPEWVSELKKGV